MITTRIESLRPCHAFLTAAGILSHHNIACILPQKPHRPLLPRRRRESRWHGRAGAVTQAYGRAGYRDRFETFRRPKEVGPNPLLRFDRERIERPPANDRGSSA